MLGGEIVGDSNLRTVLLCSYSSIKYPELPIKYKTVQRVINSRVLFNSFSRRQPGTSVGFRPYITWSKFAGLASFTVSLLLFPPSIIIHREECLDTTSHRTEWQCHILQSWRWWSLTYSNKQVSFFSFFFPTLNDAFFRWVEALRTI